MRGHGPKWCEMVAWCHAEGLRQQMEGLAGSMVEAQKAHALRLLNKMACGLQFKQLACWHPTWAHCC